MATKDEKLKAIHEQALREFDEIQSAVRDERLQCLEDRRFYSIAGAQWEGPLGEQFENKPRFEVNKIHLAVMRIINEYRNNRITVDFLSSEGDEYDKLADTCDGLYRADEENSGAEEAYDNAFEEGVGGGFGAWRLRADYEDDMDEENEKQRIMIEPIFDADSSVFFDLNAKRQDKADAKHCFVLTSMTPATYEDAYGDSISTWDKSISQTEFDWNSPDVVFVAEYYRAEESSELIRTFVDIAGEEKKYREQEFKDDETLEEKLLAVGSQEVRSRRVKTKKVHKYILSGGKVLEDCGFIAGKNIPIVPFYGKRWFVDNVERCMGHVRLAKDAQRLKNMQLSKLGEISALSTVQKPIVTPEQIAGHSQMWADDNIKNYPYLLLNPIIDANGNQQVGGPLSYTMPPAIPPAMAALMQITEQDIQDILGNQQGGEQIVSGISGKAVEMIQTRLDMQTFIYMSNMAKAIKRSGEIWLSMAKDILIEPGRKMKTVGLQGEVGRVELSNPMINPDTNEVEYENDLSEAKFDIIVDVGPSSSTKRASTVRALTGMMQVTTDPETMQVLSAMSMMNMEGEGIQDVRSFFRKKLLKMGAVKPTENETRELMQEAQNTPPDANTLYLTAAAKNENAKATKAEAETFKTIAQAEETNVKTAETIANMDMKEQQHVIATLEKIKGIQGE